MSKQYKNMKTKSSDEFQTPEIALHCLLPYLKPERIIWECAWGEGSLARHLEHFGYLVTGDPQEDFLCAISRPCNCIVTNPPYSLKDKFIRHCYELDKPWALLLPLTALGAQKRIDMYRKYGGLQLIVPRKRINFVTPTGKSHANGSSAWYHVAWFTWKLNLPKDLMFVDLEA